MACRAISPPSSERYPTTSASTTRTVRPTQRHKISDRAEMHDRPHDAGACTGCDAEGRPGFGALARSQHVTSSVNTGLP